MQKCGVHFAWQSQKADILSQQPDFIRLQNGELGGQTELLPRPIAVYYAAPKCNTIITRISCGVHV